MKNSEKRTRATNFHQEFVASANDEKMNNAEFDKLATSYDDWHAQLISGSGWPREYFLEYKIKEMSRVLSRIARRSRPSSPSLDKENTAPQQDAHSALLLPPTETVEQSPNTLKILDFGCGVGDVTPYIRKYFPHAEIFGVDISRECIETARAKIFPSIHYAPLPDGWPHCGTNTADDHAYCNVNANTLPPFPFSETFDLVFISNVFHHTTPDTHAAVLAALHAQMNKNAQLFIFEINPYNPATRHVFNKYEKPIDKNANLVNPRRLNKLMREAGFATSRNKYTVFFPRALRFLLPLERPLNWLPLGAHYYMHGSAR